MYELDLLRDRGDQYSSSEGYAKYRFRVYEDFPEDFDFDEIVNKASTKSDADLLSLRHDQVWLLPVDKSEIGDRYVSLPSTAMGIYRREEPDDT